MENTKLPDDKISPSAKEEFIATISNGQKNDDNKSKGTNSNGKILCFNKEMLPCKLLFFAEAVSFRSLFSFMGLFYQSTGMTVSMIGLSNSIVNISTFLLFPMWGAFVDSLKKHRVMFITVILITATLLEFAKPWVVMLVAKNDGSCINGTLSNVSHHRKNLLFDDRHIKDKPWNYSRNHLYSNFACAPHYDNGFAMSYYLKCMNSTASKFYAAQNQNCTTEPVLSNPNILFYTVTGHSLLASFFFLGVRTYTDSATIKTIYTRSVPYRIGEQKILAPIGAALGTLLSGVVVDHYHPHNLSPYLASFYLYLVFSLFILPLLYIVTKQAKWDHGKEEKSGKKISLRQCLVQSCKNRDNVVFFVSVFFSGLGISVWNHYLFFFMHHTMNTSKTTMALTKVIGMATSLIVLPLSSKIINFVGGGMRCLTADMFLGAVRLLLLSYCTQAWQVLLLEPLFGILPSSIAMTEQIWHMFPKEITTTALALLHCFRWVAPSMLAWAIGGHLYHLYGGARLFRGAAVLCAGCWVLMFVYFEILFREKGTVAPNAAAAHEEKKEEDTGV